MGSILQSSQVARQQAVAKAEQVRRSQQAKRNVAQPAEEEAVHQVESSEELSPTHDREAQSRQPKPPKRRSPGDDGDDGQEHVDLTA
jgi:hypothetical protein